MTLLIAYGNPLRQDDGVSWRVAEILANRQLKGLEILTCHQLTPDLAEPVSRASLVIFVDAAAEGRQGDAVACHPVTPATATGPISTHMQSPESLLSLAAALYGTSPPGWMVTIKGFAFGHGDDLSLQTSMAATTAVDLITQFFTNSSTD